MKYEVTDFTKVIAGDIGFTLTHGPGRYTIPLGQLFIGDQSAWEHVKLGLNGNIDAPIGMFGEARPPKARIAAVQQDEDTLWYRLPLTDEQRARIDAEARRDMRAGDIKYAWLAFLNMGLLKLGVRPEFIKNQVESGKAKICSQYVDHYLTNAGMDVLQGVFPGEVSPGDLSFRFANDPSIKPFRIDGKDPWTRPTR